jgi:hypothetical protein
LNTIANWQLLFGEGYRVETGVLRELKAQVVILRHSGYDDDMGSMICQSYGSHREKFDQTFIGSDELFAKIKGLAQNGRITSINGDVTDPQVFRSLASELDKKQVKVSAFDISNIPDYLSREKLIALIDNLQMLPWDEDGKVLFTSAFAHLNNVPGDSFGYLFVNAKDLDLVREAKVSGKQPEGTSGLGTTYLTSQSVKSVNLAHQTCTGAQIQQN